MLKSRNMSDYIFARYRSSDTHAKTAKERNARLHKIDNTTLKRNNYRDG